MSILVFGLIAALALALMFGLTHGSAAAQRLSSAFQHARTQAELGWEWFVDQYEQHIQPLIRNLGWVTMPLLAISGLSAFFLEKAKDTTPFLFFVSALCILAFSAGGLVQIWRQMRRTPREFSVFSLATWIFLAYLLVGVALFVAGITNNERKFAVLGAAYILCAREVLFFEMYVAGYGLWLGVKTIEGSGNLVFKTAIGLLTSGKQSLTSLIGPEGIDVFPEQKINPAIQSAKRRISLALYPVLTIGILTANLVAVCLTLLAGLALYFVWGNLAGEGIDVASRRRRSAQLLEIVTYALLGVIALVALVPGFEPAFDAQVQAAKKWIVDFVSCRAGAMFPSLKIAIAGLIVGGIVFGYVYPWKDAAKLSNMRKLVAVPFGLLAVMCLVGGTISLLSKGSGDTVSICGLSLSRAQAPVVTLENDRPRLTWTEARNALEYRIERRSLNAKEFKPVSGGTSIKPGVTTWVDTELAERGEFYYRLVVVYNDGRASQPSPEVSVVIPALPVTKAAPQSSASTQASASASASAAATTSPPKKSAAMKTGDDALAKTTKDMCAVVGCGQ